MRVFAFTVLLASHFATAETDWIAEARKLGRYDQEWKVEDWEQTEVTIPHKLYGAVQKTTYRSPVLRLMKGEAHFSLNPITRIPFPEGNYSVIRADWTIVEGGSDKEIPLTEVYNHHWLVGTKTDPDPLVSCENNLFFGAGAEMRGMPTVYAEGFGARRINAKGYCGGNVHFIRTEDLATNWTGLNDPSKSKDPFHAAVKNCIECGWAPHRSAECTKALDGNFGCCLSGSRCPVNHPEDKSANDYQLKYEITWTKDLNAVKDIRVGVLDVSNGLIEWNVGPNENNTKAGQVCDDTLCNITHTWTVDQHTGFEDGICPGEMKWAYGHQHIGAINTTMKINGKPICTSEAIYGTDPKNTPGNEFGYVVNFTRCIDSDNLHNSVRINKGDKVTVSALYDVDVTSTRSIMPGGKHGGIMGLFFYQMVCDPGTFNEGYTCAQSSCVPVGKIGSEYSDLASCQAGCK